MRNKGKIKGLLLAFSFAAFLSMGFDCHAEELSGEQTISQEEYQAGEVEHSDEITAMDENGNIIVVGDSDGMIESSGVSVFSRTTPLKVVNFNTKNGSVTEYKEYSTGAAGYTNGDYGADAAYLGTENGKVKFMLSGVVGLVDEDEVQVVNVTDVSSVSYYMVKNGRLWHYACYNMNSTGSFSVLDQGGAPSYLTTGQEYYSYDGHYFYVDYGTMLDDYVNNTRENSVNPSKPFYNYYQYLPLRSKMTYSESTLKSLITSATVSTSKMRGTAGYFVSYQNTYGVNALLMTGVAANESAWGNSSISQNKNNLFGLNAVDTSAGTSANTYASVQECIRQFAETYMSKRYLRPGYTYYHGGFLGNKASGINVSYASDPYWGEKAANVAWTLDKSAGSTDCGTYTIGIKDTLATTHNSVNVRAGSSTSSTALYKTGAWTSYAVLLQKETTENGFYKIQSDGVLNSGRTAINTSSGAYNISSMYAYISADYVTIVNDGEDISGTTSDNNTSDDSTSTTATYTTYKTTTSVNYRTGPGTSYDKAGTLSSGTQIQVEDGYSKTANGYTWYRFKLNSKNYYIASNYVTKVTTTTTTTLSKPTLVSAKYSSNAVTVTWKSVSGAAGYYVYRKVSGGSWSKIGTVSSASTVTYKDSSSLTEGKTYVYTVRAYKGSTLSGYDSTGVSVTIPAKTYTSAIVTSKVYYRSGPGTSYSNLGTLAQGKIIRVEDGYSKTANGYTWYRFKMDSKNYYVAAKYVKKISSSIAKPTLVSAKYSSGAVTFTWKKVSGATGYYVYRKVKGGSWSRIKVITSGSTVSYKDSSVASGKTYYYTVRAYTASKISNCNTTGVSVKTSTTYTTYVTTSKVNYRTAAGLSKTKAGTFAKGTKISVEDGYSVKADGYTWYRFKLNSKNYYIVSNYVKKQ